MKKILLIENSVLIFKMVEKAFSGDQYRVFFEINGNQAVETARSVQPDIILMSFILKDRHGLDICKQIKEIPSLKRIPIIFITSNNSEKALLEGFNSGAVDYITKPFKLSALFARVNSHLSRMIEEPSQLNYNELTGLLNRFSFYQTAKEVKGIMAHSALAVFELNNIKYINDTYGFGMGDAYIRLAAKTLTECFQHQCVIGHLTDEKFQVFLYNCNSKKDILEQFEQAYKILHSTSLILNDEREFKVLMSSGIAWYGEESKNLEELARFAEFALMQGRGRSNGTLHIFNKSRYEDEYFMITGCEELEEMLEKELVDYAFQPIVHAVTGKLYGYEALIRPRSKVLNTPIKVLKLAKAQSKLSQIEKLTMFKVLETAMQFELNDTKIFLNSISNQCLTEDDICEIEKVFGAILKNVVLEVTEDEKLDEKKWREKTNIAKRWGALIALDDYGSGYNNEGTLLTVNPHIIKIDKFLIDNIEMDLNRQALLRKLVAFGKEQNIAILAEGIETYNQMAHLIKMGVTLLQGYYIGFPQLQPAPWHHELAKQINEIQTTMRSTVE